MNSFDFDATVILHTNSTATECLDKLLANRENGTYTSEDEYSTLLFINEVLKRQAKHIEETKLRMAAPEPKKSIVRRLFKK